MEDLCLEDQLTQIFELEVKNLSIEEEIAILPFLHNFICQYKTSLNIKVIIAVGSAIRKYISAININYMDEIGLLLVPDYHNMISQDVELEFMKMIKRKFIANPQSEKTSFYTLEKEIINRVEAYINPYILPTNKFAVISMNCIQALVGMHSDKIHSILTSVKGLPFNWFGEQLKMRFNVMENDWIKRSGKKEFYKSISFIQDLQNLL